MARILVYSHDTFGLGNIRRMLRISEALAARDDAVSVLIVTGSPMLHAFRLPPRIDYVKLPCLARDTRGRYGVRHLDMGYADALAMRSELIRAAAAGFAPDLVLIDKKPLGVGGELAPVLAELAALASPPPCHLLLRDILDTPEATASVWAANHYHEAIARYYESVLVVGDPRVFDMAEAYRFPASTRAKLEYCGYIDRSSPPPTANSFNGNDRKQVLVHAGGGEDGGAIIAAIVDALALAGADRDFDCRIVGGPELGAAERVALSRKARALNHVEWLDFTDAMGSEIARADLVVSMGGYNSVCEILSSRKRAIVIPRSEPVREQRMRAEAMDRLGLLRMLPLERLDPERLLRMIRTELDFANVVSSRSAAISFDGLDRIADRLISPSQVKAGNRKVMQWQ